MMHGREKSDLAIVAAKLANKAERSAAEPVERRAGTKGNADQQSTHRTQSWTSVSQALERIRKAASERKKERFTALFHHINTELLREAFSELSRNAAPGVDRLTWRAYEADLGFMEMTQPDAYSLRALTRIPSELVPRARTGIARFGKSSRSCGGRANHRCVQQCVCQNIIAADEEFRALNDPPMVTRSHDEIVLPFPDEIAFAANVHLPTTGEASAGGEAGGVSDELVVQEKEVLSPWRVPVGNVRVKTGN
jgi:hypothetical protein